MHGTNRHSYGTVYYPLSFLILVLLCWETVPQFISISILVLGLSDAAAAIVGENLRAPHVYYLTSDKKSLEGSAAMFATTFLVVAVLLDTSIGLNGSLEFTCIPNLSRPILVGAIAFGVALFATSWEAISSKGLDNLTIPLSTAFVLHSFLIPLPHHHCEQFLIGLTLAAIFAAISYPFVSCRRAEVSERLFWHRSFLAWEDGNGPCLFSPSLFCRALFQSSARNGKQRTS